MAHNSGYLSKNFRIFQNPLILKGSFDEWGSAPHEAMLHRVIQTDHIFCFCIVIKRAIFWTKGIYKIKVSLHKGVYTQTCYRSPIV